MTQRQTSQGSLFAAIAEGVASQEQSARMQKLEIGLGFLGFFTLVSLVSTVVATLGGKAALGEALVSALLVAMTWPVLQRWRRLGRRIAEEAAQQGRPVTHRIA